LETGVEPAAIDGYVRVLSASDAARADFEPHCRDFSPEVLGETRNAKFLAKRGTGLSIAAG
jgi:hypothetical protein